MPYIQSTHDPVLISGNEVVRKIAAAALTGLIRAFRMHTASPLNFILSRHKILLPSTPLNLPTSYYKFISQGRRPHF